jgi:hypothetical protein
MYNLFHLGLDAGFWQFFMMTGLVGSGFTCVALCSAEMASMLPFAGVVFSY